jgi:hypothetical protein
LNLDAFNGRYLWIRRARSHDEWQAAVTDLAFTAGDMKRLDDRMHCPPARRSEGWAEVTALTFTLTP